MICPHALRKLAKACTSQRKRLSVLFLRLQHRRVKYMVQRLRTDVVSGFVAESMRQCLAWQSHQVPSTHTACARKGVSDTTDPLVNTSTDLLFTPVMEGF
jgi:hypothetical protein